MDDLPVVPGETSGDLSLVMPVVLREPEGKVLGLALEIERHDMLVD